MVFTVKSLLIYFFPRTRSLLLLLCPSPPPKCQCKNWGRIRVIFVWGGGGGGGLVNYFCLECQLWNIMYPYPDTGIEKQIKCTSSPPPRARAWIHDDSGKAGQKCMCPPKKKKKKKVQFSYWDSYPSHSGSNMHWTFDVYLCWDKANLFNIIKSIQPKISIAKSTQYLLLLCESNQP